MAATRTTLLQAIAILEKANLRTRAVKNAIAYLRDQLSSAAYDWSCFHDASFADFRRIQSVRRPADYVSRSGSQYWLAKAGEIIDGPTGTTILTNDSVIRLADHWCSGIRSCAWLLDGGECHDLAYGFAPLNTFRARRCSNGCWME